MKKKELYGLITKPSGVVKQDPFYNFDLKMNTSLNFSRYNNKDSIDFTINPKSRDKNEQVLFDKMKSIMGELRSTTPDVGRYEKNKVQLMKSRVEKVLQSNSPLRTRINPVN